MQTAALILGILALAFLFVPGANIVLSPMLGTAALVLGLIGRRAALARKEDGFMGKAGFVTGVVALVVSLILIFVLVGLIKSSCKDCKSGCDWGRKDDVSELRYEDLPPKLRKELRDEVRKEVAREMEKAREDRLEYWKNRDPEWKESFEKRVEEWVEWLDMMPIHEDIKGDEPARPPEKTPEETPEEPTEQPPGEKKPAKKPALLPDTTYPGDALE